ncbi:MAG: hypothetical protein HY016_01005 [Nitrosomonadales bacterium]|nr:hypothetical protein [Nitrosomonadales bacterium]
MVAKAGAGTVVVVGATEVVVVTVLVGATVVVAATVVVVGATVVVVGATAGVWQAKQLVVEVTKVWEAGCAPTTQAPQLGSAANAWLAKNAGNTKTEVITIFLIDFINVS